METNSTTLNKTETTNDNINESLQCLISSTTSKSAWMRSLGQGCLNKSVGDKFRVYSHLRDLFTKLEPFRGLKSTTGEFIPRADVNIDGVSPQYVGREQETVVKNPALSLVILEDIRKPLHLAEKASPMLFTAAEFFRYVSSDNWGGKISLCVTGGEILDLLLAALCYLERMRLVNSYVVYSNLNNRVKCNIVDGTSMREDLEVSAQMLADNALKAQESLPKAYEPNKEFVLEKMNVEIVFYEKSEASNIPYDTQNTDDSEQQNDLLPLEREVLRLPYALQQHKMNHVRLPLNEDIDQPSVIEHFQTELEDLKKVAEAEQPEVFTDKPNTTTGKIEMIADGPYFVDYKLHDGGSDRIKMITTQNVKESQLKIKEYFKLSQHTLENIGMFVEEKVAERRKSNVEKSERQSGNFIDVCAISASPSAGGTYTILKSPSEIFSEVEEKPVYRRLNLARNELYVTGLYHPNTVNKISVTEKLQHRKQLRAKERYEKERNIYQNLKEKLSFDFRSRLKHLSKRKEDWTKRVSSSLFHKDKKTSKDSKSAANDSWSKYSKEQEEMEMDSALNNSVEKKILERLAANIVSKNEYKNKDVELEVKKTGKNKNKNNQISYDLYSCSDQRISDNKAPNFSYSNAPAANTVEGQFSQTNKPKPLLKLPPIKRAKQQNSDPRTKKDNNSITFPLLRNTNNHRAESKNNNKTAIKKMKEEFHNESRRFRVTNIKDMFESLQTSACSLDPNQKEKRILFNKNQNQSGSNEDIEDEELNPIIYDKEMALPKEPEQLQNTTYENEAHSFVLDETNILGEAQNRHQNVLDAYYQRTKLYNCECSCQECETLGNTSNLCADLAHCTEFPLFLGRMRRDFRFLKSKTNIHGDKSSTTNPFQTPEVTEEFVRKKVLKLLDTMMIRKEIVTSSLGYTYITITFAKPIASK